MFPPGALGRDAPPAGDDGPRVDGGPPDAPFTTSCGATTFDPRRYAVAWVEEFDMPWDRAREQCAARGWELASPETADEAEAIGSWTLGNNYWVGMFRVGPGIFETFTGCPIPVDAWGTDQPDGGIAEECGMLSVNDLHDYGCEAAGVTDFVCEQPRPTTPACMDDANRPFDLSRYYASPDQKSYADAAGFCAASGDHLVVFDTPDEHAAVHANFGDEYWIGATDDVAEGGWATPTGCPGYLPWNFGEPSNTSDAEDCASLTAPGSLNDLQCATLRRALCESSL